MTKWLNILDGWILQKGRQFFTVDLRSLALFRIGLACAILFDLYLRSLDLRLFYTDDGIMPRALLFKEFPDPWRFSVYLLSGSTLFAGTLFVIQAFLAGLLLIGWRTRWVVFFSWIMMISLHVRNPMINDSGDQLMRMILFWSLFLPLGACFSVDGALNTLQKKSYSYLSVGSAGFLLQVCLMYWWTGYLKAQTTEWQNGDAIFLALNITGYTQGIAEFAKTLNPELLRILTKATLWFELVGPFLFFSPIFFLFFRRLGILLFVGLHFVLSLVLQLGVFPFFDFVAIIPFIPALFWEKNFPRWNAPGYSGMRLEVSRVPEARLKALLLMKTILFIPDGALKVVETPDGRDFLRGLDERGNFYEVTHLWRQLAKSSLVFGWLGRVNVPGAVLQFFRSLFSRLSFLFHLSARPAPQPSFTGNLLAGIFLVYIVFWNMWNSTSIFQMPQILVPSGLFTYVEQRWGMYAPPSKFHCWVVAHGKLKTGEEIDLINLDHPRPVNYEQPSPPDILYRTVRQKLYLMQLPQEQFKDQSGYVTWNICREWNRTHDGNQQLKEVTLNIVYQYFFPDIKAPWTVGLWYQVC